MKFFTKTIKTFSEDLAKSSDSLEIEKVYGEIADFLSQTFDSSSEVSLHATYALCNDEEKLTEANSLASPEGIQGLLQSARQSLNSIILYYEKAEGNEFLRKIAIKYISDGALAEYEVKRRMGWSDLPSDVRNEILSEGTKPLAFKVYESAEEVTKEGLT